MSVVEKRTADAKAEKELQEAKLGVNRTAKAEEEAFMKTVESGVMDDSSDIERYKKLKEKQDMPFSKISMTSNGRLKSTTLKGDELKEWNQWEVRESRLGGEGVSDWDIETAERDYKWAEESIMPDPEKITRKLKELEALKAKRVEIEKQYPTRYASREEFRWGGGIEEMQAERKAGYAPEIKEVSLLKQQSMLDDYMGTLDAEATASDRLALAEYDVKQIQLEKEASAEELPVPPTPLSDTPPPPPPLEQTPSFEPEALRADIVLGNGDTSDYYPFDGGTVHYRYDQNQPWKFTEAEMIQKANDLMSGKTIKMGWDIIPHDDAHLNPYAESNKQGYVEDASDSEWEGMDDLFDDSVAEIAPPPPPPLEQIPSLEPTAQATTPPPPPPLGQTPSFEPEEVEENITIGTGNMTDIYPFDGGTVRYNYWQSQKYKYTEAEMIQAANDIISGKTIEFGWAHIPQDDAHLNPYAGRNLMGDVSVEDSDADWDLIEDDPVVEIAPPPPIQDITPVTAPTMIPPPPPPPEQPSAETLSEAEYYGIDENLIPYWTPPMDMSGYADSEMEASLLYKQSQMTADTMVAPVTVPTMIPPPTHDPISGGLLDRDGNIQVVRNDGGSTRMSPEDYQILMGITADDTVTEDVETSLPETSLAEDIDSSVGSAKDALAGTKLIASTRLAGRHGQKVAGVANKLKNVVGLSTAGAMGAGAMGTGTMGMVGAGISAGGSLLSAGLLGYTAGGLINDKLLDSDWMAEKLGQEKGTEGVIGAWLYDLLHKKDESEIEEEGTPSSGIAEAVRGLGVSEMDVERRKIEAQNELNRTMSSQSDNLGKGFLDATNNLGTTINNNNQQLVSMGGQNNQQVEMPADAQLLDIFLGNKEFGTGA